MAVAKSTGKGIYYNTLGSGAPVVLIKGLGCHSEHWNGWEQNLARNFKILTVDCRGLGKTSLPMRPWDSIATLARDVQDVLTTERISAAHIVGVSLGGMIALQFALDFPKGCLSACAINSSIGNSGHLRLSVEGLRLLTSSPFDRKGMYRKLANLLTSPSCPDEKKKLIYEDWKTIDSRFPQSISAVTFQLLAAKRWGTWQNLADMKPPVKIIYGEDDLFVPKGNSIFLGSKCPTSELSAIQESGHEPHIDQPERLYEMLTEFIGRHSK